MRWIVGGRAVAKAAESTSQMGRFETEFLATDENLTALAGLSGQWIDRVDARHPPRVIILDMDSSVSPAHGDQEGTAYNGHFGCSCYHPLFVFNQFGDLERCALRPGNVHSARGWHDVLEPVVARYRDWKVRRYFRGDAAFASPDLYEFLEAEGYKYAIRLMANAVLQASIAHLLTRPVGRPPNHVRRFHASFSCQAASWNRKRRVVARVEWHPGELVPRGRLHRHQPDPTCRTRGGLLQPAGHSGTAYQGRQECHPVDAPVVPEIPQQRGPASASRPGLQPRQLHADAGLAEGGGALVSDHAQEKADQDWCQGREPRPVRHFPTGGGCGAEGAVPKNPPSHRWAAAGPCAGRPTTGRIQCAIPAARSGFSSPNQPDQVRTTAYHDGSGPNSRSDAHSAIIVGGWEKQSGESRVCLAKQLGSLLRVARRGGSISNSTADRTRSG